ncbi:MAG TPA: AtpZ/AtpI family protein [Bauldia sp.]|nr:AtpZ/AtpI family protein [Bauldia sp.]
MSERDGQRPVPDHSQPPDDAELSRRLHELDRRLGENRAERASDRVPVDAPPKPGFAMAMRLGADFVAGVAVGAALGWGIDRLFGTSPWGLVIFLLLGFGAGIFSVLRAAGLMKPAGK